MGDRQQRINIKRKLHKWQKVISTMEKEDKVNIKEADNLVCMWSRRVGK